MDEITIQSPHMQHILHAPRNNTHPAAYLFKRFMSVLCSLLFYDSKIYIINNIVLLKLIYDEIYNRISKNKNNIIGLIY